MRRFLFIAAVVGGTLALMGCASAPPPVAQAPPVYNSGPVGSPGYGGQMQASNPGGGVYQWQDVPVNQQVPITRAVFDQGGYQIFAQSGETIVVPFVNQNLYALKFGQTGGNPYFVNEGNAPVLYLPPGGYLENAAAQNARWYPFPNGFSYQRPVYVSLAPTWSDYVGMGWYPGMQYYGGMWGYTPYSHLGWMPGFYVSIGGTRYANYTSYHNYYTTNRSYVPNRIVYNNYNTRSTGSFSGGRSSGFGRSSGSTGSFGGGRSSSGFGGATGSTGSFGGGRSNVPSNSGSSFGGGRSSSSFGSSGSTSGSGFGSTRRPSGSFGSGGSGFSNTPRSSGSSFGGGRSTGSGSSFGGGRSTSGSSFGGGRSSGSSFGGGRRR